MKLITHLLILPLLMATLCTEAQQHFSATQREACIQRAVQLRKEENYNGAIQQLDSILHHTPADASILLFKGDLLLQAKRYADAVITYQQLVPLNFEPTITKINLSYALFMNHKPAKALAFAKKAWAGNPKNPNAIVNYFNAMLWNLNTQQAANFLQQQDSLLTTAQQLVLKARLYTTSGNYNKGLQYYDSLVGSYNEKYYVQEYAEVLLGKKEIKQSEKIMKQSKSLFSANEYNSYQDKLKATQIQTAGTEMVYFKDVAKNIRIENSVWWQQSEARTYRFRLSAGTSSITSAQQEKTTAQHAHVHIDER